MRDIEHKYEQEHMYTTSMYTIIIRNWIDKYFASLANYHQSYSLKDIFQQTSSRKITKANMLPTLSANKSLVYYGAMIVYDRYWHNADIS